MLIVLVGTITVHICHMFAISRSKSSEKVSNDKTQNYLFFDIADFDNTVVRTMLEKWKGNPASGGTKGQLNSEWIYEVIISPKMPTKIFQISALPNKQGL